MTKKQKLPLVSVCTPTFNRRPFIETMFQCFRNQTYPKDRMEWIIIDDGTDKIEDLIKAADIPQIKYYALDKKMTLGAKRNFMHTKTNGSILVYMDDDDYYPPERVAHAVERLQSDKNALCAGASEIYVYFKHIHKMYQAGPYGPTHATAGTFAFRRALLDVTKYEDNAALAEEKKFLKDYTIPFVQLDPLKTILVFAHDQNTFDKKKLLGAQNEHFFKESSKTVDMFIRHPSEARIKQFFMQDIDAQLMTYTPGDPKMKPDVIEQMKEMDEMRKTMQQQPVIMMQNGSESRQMTMQEIAFALQQQGEEIQRRGDRIEQQAGEIQRQEDRIEELEKYIATIRKCVGNGP